jgi:hypothetical protein
MILASRREKFRLQRQRRITTVFSQAIVNHPVENTVNRMYKTITLPVKTRQLRVATRLSVSVLWVTALSKCLFHTWSAGFILEASILHFTYAHLKWEIDTWSAKPALRMTTNFVISLLGRNSRGPRFAKLHLNLSNFDGLTRGLLVVWSLLGQVRGFSVMLYTMITDVLYLFCDVIHNDSCLCTSVVHGCQAMVPLLTRRIPYLKFEFLVVYAHGLCRKGSWNRHQLHLMLQTRQPKSRSPKIGENITLIYQGSKISKIRHPNVRIIDSITLSHE